MLEIPALQAALGRSELNFVLFRYPTHCRIHLLLFSCLRWRSSWWHCWASVSATWIAAEAFSIRQDWALNLSWSSACCTSSAFKHFGNWLPHPDRIWHLQLNPLGSTPHPQPGWCPLPGRNWTTHGHKRCVSGCTTTSMGPRMCSGAEIRGSIWFTGARLSLETSNSPSLPLSNCPSSASATDLLWAMLGLAVTPQFSEFDLEWEPLTWLLTSWWVWGHCPGSPCHDCLWSGVTASSKLHHTKAMMNDEQ